MIEFRCNICGAESRANRDDFGREHPSCRACGSTMRMRSIVHALSLGLYGKSLAIDDFPAEPRFRGFGMSDWPEYADRLAERLDYQNTFLHQEPRLDILAPDPELFGTLDFLISTDVFEHVAPPVAPAFERAYQLLRPGGVFVFSVPYTLEDETIEHFPELSDYRVVREGGDFVLQNRTRDGREQTFRDLVFHGGPGETLEMRVFCQTDLERHFERAGFEAPQILGADEPRFGLIHEYSWSLTWLVRKPEQADARSTSTDAEPKSTDVVLFDQHSRYKSLAQALEGLVEPGDTVLDVGAGEARLLGRFAPQLECWYLDPLLDEDLGGRVLAGGFGRLLEDARQWDWLVAVDTLEHIPRSQRDAFLDTLLGRARVGVVLSGPCIEDEGALDVDREVNAMYRAKTGEDYPWLHEHIEFGLPSRAEIERRFQEAELHVASLGNGRAAWLRRLLPIFISLLDEPEHLPLLEDLSESFNRELYPFESLEPVYRRIVIGSKRPFDPAVLRGPDPARREEDAEDAWARFERECVAKLGLHADGLATALREARIGEQRDSLSQARASRLEKQLQEQQALLGAERAHSERIQGRLDQLESSRVVRFLRRIGLLAR